jgi:SAM-dependent methyltransferase
MSGRTVLKIRSPEPNAAAQAYHAIGERYGAYADGQSATPFDFGGRYSYGDRRLWAAIENKLVAFAESGRDRIRILDVGCGPGVWLQRTVERACALGIPFIDAMGIDVSSAQVAIARLRTAALPTMPGVSIRIIEGDVTAGLPVADETTDLCLCLNGVLNHLDASSQDIAAAELARVTRGHLIVTARTVGSMPSIYVDGVEAAADFRQDHDADRLSIDLRDGRHIEFRSHLFRAAELEALFARYIMVSRLTGLDLFHSRFAPDPRWNPCEGQQDDAFHTDLERLEQTYGADPHFIDHATYLLLIAEQQRLMEC